MPAHWNKCAFDEIFKKKKEITKVPLLLDAVTFNMDSAKKTNEIAQVQ